jgi:hypothetical protein
MHVVLAILGVILGFGLLQFALWVVFWPLRLLLRVKD